LDLKVSFGRKERKATVASWTTVVIGKNGVGKSRLLAGLADLFEAADRKAGRRRSDDILVSRCEYVVDDSVYEIEVDGNFRLLARKDGKRCDLGDLALPTRVIALTTTPFDKFRASRALRSAGVPREAEQVERYSYLGLRDRTGRASPTAALFRALEVLFEASESDAVRRTRVAEVFRFLGYHPRIVVRYEYSPIARARLERIVNGEPLDQILGERRTGYSLSVIRLLERDPRSLDDLRAVGRDVLSRYNGRAIDLRADFAGESDDRDFFRRLQVLRRADIIRMQAVEVEREVDGAFLDLRLASSGELGIVTGFLGLASVIENGSLVFIDEPEISLHPEWQTKYVDLLRSTFESFTGCHFILATHSPLILPFPPTPTSAA